MIVLIPQLILSPSFWTGSDCIQVGGRKQKVGFPFFSGISPVVKFGSSPRNDMHISVIICLAMCISLGLGFVGLYGLIR